MESQIIDIVVEAVQMPLSYLMNAEKRIYWLYLLSSGCLALYVFWFKYRKGTLFHYLFNKKVWASKSAGVDYLLIFLNALIKVIFVGPFLIYGLHIAFNTNEYLLTHFGYPTSKLTLSQSILGYTLTLAVIGDFMTYLVHYLMHRIPILWEFHKVHHSATTLNPITQYRLHPIELILNNVRGILTFGIITGVFDYLTDHGLQKYTMLGVNILAFGFLFWGSNLRHSHVKLTYPKWLEYVLISPFQHQIHHSDNPEHYHKNMGAKFAIWDWIFGTLMLSKQVKRLRFGLGTENKNFDSLWKNIWNPFVGVSRIFKGFYTRCFKK